MSDLKRKILFLTGTRADFGKIKSLILEVEKDENFEIEVFVTGMHMLRKYGNTVIEVERSYKGKIYRYINQNESDSMDTVLAKTIGGLSDYLKNNPADLLVVHGDRVEALAGAIVGSLSNVRVAHIEGGEVSGTIDESIRHAISKLSHLHFVANQEARNRLLQMGETSQSVFVIGSPDIDIMNSNDLPSLDRVKEKYLIPFEEYAILMFHPVTTEFDDLFKYTNNLVDAVLDSQMNFVVIYPNNDHGSEKIFEAYERLKDNPRIKIFPSMRFEYFLTLMKSCKLILGNSSAGIREAPHYGVPTVNIGTRQHNRAFHSSIINTSYKKDDVLLGIRKAQNMKCEPESLFGDGNSSKMFLTTLKSSALWDLSVQKQFRDMGYSYDH